MYILVSLWLFWYQKLQELNLIQIQVFFSIPVVVFSTILFVNSRNLRKKIGWFFFSSLWMSNKKGFLLSHENLNGKTIAISIFWSMKNFGIKYKHTSTVHNTLSVPYSESQLLLVSFLLIMFSVKNFGKWIGCEIQNPLLRLAKIQHFRPLNTQMYLWHQYQTKRLTLKKPKLLKI